MGVKFCMHVGLLSRQVFSPFGEDWLSGSHRVALVRELAARFSIVRKGSGAFDISSAGTCSEARWAVGIEGGGVA